ncbi:uncharacterized protein LOC143035529 [Oratosquilla oratoria]|uniref:uncharacterized protein LOC143035529 n=1 Tax=Oratosquilla oratoria TaxID=337810 RepID=UPI003F776F71
MKTILDDTNKFKIITTNPTLDLRKKLNKIIRKNNTTAGTTKLPPVEGDHKLGYAFGNHFRELREPRHLRELRHVRELRHLRELWHLREPRQLRELRHHGRSLLLMLWRNGQLEFLGHQCEYSVRPKFISWELYFYGHMSCPSLGGLSVTHRTRSRSKVVERTMEAFVKDAVRKKLITESQAQRWIN